MQGFIHSFFLSFYLIKLYKELHPQNLKKTPLLRLWAPVNGSLKPDAPTFKGSYWSRKTLKTFSSSENEGKNEKRCIRINFTGCVRTEKPNFLLCANPTEVFPIPFVSGEEENAAPETLSQFFEAKLTPFQFCEARNSMLLLAPLNSSRFLTGNALTNGMWQLFLDSEPGDGFLSDNDHLPFLPYWSSDSVCLLSL